jgi:predicted transcriptional regulator
MAKTLTEMAAEIAMAQSSHATLSPDEIADFVRKTFSVLKEIQQKEQTLMGEEAPAAEEAEKAIDLTQDPKQSIQRNKVICLECGKEFKQITNRHLKSHGLTAKENRKKWGFSARQPLAAKALTAKRRKTAKTLGLGDKLKERRMAKK